MPIEPSTHSGARQIVQHCLGLQPGHQLVIIMDETTIDPGVVIAEAAESLGVSQTILLVPMTMQRRIPRESDLSLLAQGAAREARAILTCINSTPECLPFRRRILETQWTARTKIGHMPGASLDVLRLADVDFERLVADCWSLEIAMARGQTLELISYAGEGTPHTLSVDIGGWERLPVASDGVIHDGVWGNVPSGETYIAPVEGSGQGSVVINGSIPGLVIEPAQEMILHFERGQLTEITPANNLAARWLHETQVQKAQEKQDPNWANLAEIGVGLNPAVGCLTGNMLFDEKAAGTAHVALGTNAFMGGTVNASIHCDMVTKGPSLIIDGKTVVDQGRLSLVASEWHEDHGEVSLQDSPLRTAVRVARSGIQAGAAANGQLQRILRPETGRVSACFVGDKNTAQLARTLYTLIPHEGDWLPILGLAGRANMELEQVRRLLHILWSYDLIEFR